MDFKGVVFTLFFLLLDFGALQKKKTAADAKHTLCRGSSLGISTVHSSAQLYEMYRAKYSNCTYVDGNLELVDLDRNYDLSFLQDIREVTGYVLIKSVMSEYLWLGNLRIIRGQLLLSQNQRSYSLYVEQNYNDMGFGLKELQFSSLHEIMNGDVYFHNNRLLCHEQTIEWNDILPPNSVVRFNDTLPKLRSCPVCDARCTFNSTPHCWGAGPNQCQNITRLNCSDQCLFRCLPGSPDVCCHSECAGGCTGPTSSTCWACKNFANDESCVNLCPPQTIYDTSSYKEKPNPDFKYIHGSICLRHCPKHLYSYESACIRECESMAVEGRCVLCTENCPKKCPGIKPPEYVHSGNIATFRGCNIVQNSVAILPSTFTGDPSRNLVGLTKADLSVFETVTEITGFLQIEGNNVTSLDYFRNLTAIGGIETIPRSVVSFRVYGTQLELLDLKFLEEIRLGSVLVENNSRLCYADGVNWKRLFTFPDQMSYVSNETKDVCAKTNHTCSSECSSDGCWGPRDDQCLSCAHVRIDKRCIASCDVMPALYQSSPTECKRCHEECRTKCRDNSSATCDECKHFKDGRNCVWPCPADKYADSQRNCQPCHGYCVGGCTGGKNTTGPGGCRSCDLVLLDAADNVTSCLNVSENCPIGYFKKALRNHPNKDLNGMQACRRCHPECRVCDEYGQSMSSCLVCTHYRQEGRCVSECPDDYYVINGTNDCLRCDNLCQNCTGPTASNCMDCKQYRVYNNSDDHSNGFYCTESCPENIPHKKVEEISTGKKATVCVEDSGSYMSPSTIGKIVGSVIGGVCFLSIVVIVIVVVLYKRAKAEANKVRLTAQLIGVSEAEPLCPTGVNPDMAKLRLIKESELRRGAMIGSGAFGSVYKGIWIPENENVKLIVAIKVLNEGLQANQTIELLDEVRIMASVSDQYCIRILAFCMTSQMMIVTQLMPHGCLLDFVRKHEAEIGSKVLLNWCTQIAKGMKYLEERSIVHRDLAARNILVQHPEHVRITDFGLSKLLDHNELAFHSAEERVPIKWMALESIQEQCFTHKSDVWSYGVTLWELFTKGGIPYETVCPNSIPYLLEKGERLPQPSICTIDVYMLMIKCWVIDRNSRPSFRYFAEAFAKMARDPGRYLVIEGDEFLRISSPMIGVKELMRYASIDSGGTEMIIAADDYLHPRGRIRSTGHSHSDHLEMVAETNIDDADGSVQHNVSSTSSYPGESNSHQRSAVAQRIRRNSQNRDSSHVIARQHSEPGGVRLNSSRYCSDPCKAAVLQQQQQQQRLLQMDASPPPPYSPQANPLHGDTVKAASRNSVSSPGHASANSVSSRGSGGSTRAPMAGQEIPLSPRFSFERKPSAREEDYLQPAGGQQTTNFADLLDSVAGGDSGGSAMTSFVSNPEYFEDVSPDRASEIRSHRRSESEDSTKYYNDLNSTSVHNSSLPPQTSPVSLSKATANGQSS